MKIINQSIRIIDYENNEVYKRDTPEEFSEYVKQLITYIDSYTSIREYKTRSVNTEVISCILDIIKNKEDIDFVTEKMETISKRLLLKEREAQSTVSKITNVQKGSLIQALLYDAELDQFNYLLAKVEHTDFVDDSDFSFKTGFSKDMKKLWKSCLFEMDDLNSSCFLAKVFLNNPAKYWHDTFLELEERTNDETNTDRAFRAVDLVLNRNLKKIAPRDYTVTRNAVISYFKSSKQIDYDQMVNQLFENYVPVELEPEKKKKLIEKLLKLPEEKNFDRQFNVVNSVIKAKIKKTYDICQGIQLKISEGIDDLDKTISAYRDDEGNKYIKIKTDNDVTFKSFSKYS